MPRRITWLRTAVVGVIILCIAAISIRTVEAAWPRLLMVHGGSLREPIVVDDWEGIRGVYDGEVLRDGGLAGRPYFELALFWGGDVGQNFEEGQPLEELRQEDAETDHIIPTQGKFYPACGNSAAAIALDTFESGAGFFPVSEKIQVWQVSRAGLAALSRFGVPVLRHSPELTHLCSPRLTHRQEN